MKTGNFGNSIKHWLARVTLLAATAALSVSVQAATPLKIGYSDWPGWVAWQVACDSLAFPHSDAAGRRRRC